MVVNPVPLAALHRKSQRTLFLRTLADNILNKAEKVFVKGDKVIHIDGENVFKLQLVPESLNLILDQKTQRHVKLQQIPWDLKELNQHVGGLRVVDNVAANYLFSDFRVSFADGSYRELGLNLSRNQMYLNQRGNPNRLAQHCLEMYAHLLPAVFAPVVKWIKENRKHSAKAQEVFGNFRAQSCFDKVQQDIRLDGIPMIQSIDRPSEVQL